MDDNGPYAWSMSGFPDDAGLGGVNDTFDDGDADYQAWANMAEFPVATPEGLLITTLEFEALAAAAATDVVMVDNIGIYSVTAIYDEEYGGWNIVDNIDSETIAIGEGGLPGDVDGDGDVDLSDLSLVLAAYGSCEGDPAYNPYADIDEDGCVDLLDLAILLANYGS